MRVITICASDPKVTQGGFPLTLRGNTDHTPKTRASPSQDIPQPTPLGRTRAEQALPPLPPAGPG